MMKRLSIFGFVICVLAMAPNVEAGPIYRLTLSSGPDSFIVNDGAILDGSTVPGVVLFNGVVGGWAISVTTGLAGTNPLLHLNSVDMTFTGAGPLKIIWSATDFSGPVEVGGLSSYVGGSLSEGGSLVYQAFAASNNLLDQYQAENAVGPALTFFGPGAFSGTVYGGPVLGGLYSVTQVAELTAVKPGSTSFDAAVAVPEPGPMMLLGGGLLGLATLVRRRTKKN